MEGPDPGSHVFTERLVAQGALDAASAEAALATYRREGAGRTFPSFLLEQGLVKLHDLVLARPDLAGAPGSSGAQTQSDVDLDVEAPGAGAAPADDPLIGAVLSGCRIERALGEGGMGTVYVAVRERDRRRVVLKFLAPHLAREPGLRKRFEREGRVLERLPEHPNVVRVFGVGEDDPPHIVMELVQGLSLERLLDERWSLPPLEATRIVRDVAQGLAAVHAHGIVHRDVKPANVVATADGAVKVLDFGLAKDLAASDLTRPGQRLGTPWYMAPEQWGNHEVDARADVFALGATYYHLVVGEPPFLGKNASEVARRIASGEYVSPRSVSPRVPVEMELLIAQMLMPERSFRYPTMEACLADIERVLEGKPPRVPCLIRREAGRPGKGIPLLPGSRFRIGRELECDVRVEDPSVSRQHAELTREASGFVLRDLGSRFGTSVEGMRVDRPVTLKDGDRLQVGKVELKFRDPTRPPDAAPALEAHEAPCHEVPEPCFEALVAAGDPRVTLALIAQLAPDPIEEQRDRATLIELLDDEGEELAARAVELAARARARLPGRLYALTTHHLGDDVDAWLAWWEQARGATPPQLVPARPPTELRLEVRRGEPAAVGLALRSGHTARIGRDEHCELCLAHRSVSRRHAAVTRLGGRLLVRDGGSRLGTLVRGQRVRATLLAPGDRIVVGDVELELAVGPIGPARHGLDTFLLSPFAFEVLLERRHRACATACVGLLHEAARPQELERLAAQLAPDAAHREPLVRALVRLARQRADRARAVLAELLGGDPARYPQTLAERKRALGPQLLPIGWLAATR